MGTNTFLKLSLNGFRDREILCTLSDIHVPHQRIYPTTIAFIIYTKQQVSGLSSESGCISKRDYIPDEFRFCPCL